MKMMLLMLGVLLLLLGCNGLLPSDKVKPFIPGVYYASWKTAFVMAVDTMTIAPVTENGSEGFLITRRTQLQFIHKGMKRAPEYSIAKWTGTYNANGKTLVLQPNGRVLYFDPEKKLMQMGTVVYRKL